MDLETRCAGLLSILTALRVSREENPSGVTTWTLAHPEEPRAFVLDVYTADLLAPPYYVDDVQSRVMAEDEAERLLRFILHFEP